MVNPRNLRRASSEEEEEGDVFDDKSEVSSSSDEEEALDVEEAAAGSSAPAEPAQASSPSGPPAGAATAVEGGNSAAKPNRAEGKREGRDEAGYTSNRGTSPETNVTRLRKEGIRENGNRRKMKTTWQLMQEDPSFVPRETRYFLHDDRRDGDSEEGGEGEGGDDSQPDTSAPRSVQIRVGPSKKLWTPDENKGVWKHDMWEQLQKEEAEARTTAYNWNRGRPGRRVGYNGYGGGGRGEKWVPRGSRGGRPGGNDCHGDDSWRGGWRPRGRGRSQAWDSAPRRQYVPRQTAAE